MFEECRRQKQVGSFHVLFMIRGHVEVRVARNSVLSGKASAANRCIVCIRNRWHHPSYLLIHPITLPSAQCWHVALLKVIQTKSIEHDHYCSLRLVRPLSGSSIDRPHTTKGGGRNGQFHELSSGRWHSNKQLQ